MGWVAMLVGVSWTGGGTLLGVQALEISVVCFTSFQDGRGLELDFGWGVGEMVALGSGDLATSQPQQEAFASFTQTKKKKVVLDTGRLSEHSAPVITRKTGTHKCSLLGWWHRLTAV